MFEFDSKDPQVQTATKALYGFTDIVRLFSLLLIGIIMLGIGTMLAIGGRPESLVPLVLGAMSLVQVPSLVKNLYRDLSGNH